MPSGYCDVLIGLQYGDEGKAKIIDTIAPNYEIVARFNGGVNAGHTVVTDRGVLALRQIPSAVEYPNTTLYIGSGCVVSADSLVNEINTIKASGYTLDDRLVISPHATLVLPHHVVLDRLFGDEIGTTGNGIGPAYGDRAYRFIHGLVCNVRMIDIIDSPKAVTKLARQHLERIKGEAGEFYSAGKILLEGLEENFSILRQYVAPSSNYLVERVIGGDRVLFEGAQSYMLDVVHGDVPYVTSSGTSVSSAYAGGDVPPAFHRHAFGIIKLIMSRVGRGPFPSELGGPTSYDYCTKNSGKDHTRDFEKSHYDPDYLVATGDPLDLGKALRMYSGEYGTGSGRPRRIGMLDLAQLKAAVLANGIDSLFLTKCDCLVDFYKTPGKKIPVVTHYDQSGEPVIKEYPAFELALDTLQNYQDFPDGLKSLVEDIEKIAQTQVVGLGVGPHRDQLVMKEAPSNWPMSPG